jgi:thiol-disulfide isomerase/thioredoxin
MEPDTPVVDEPPQPKRRSWLPGAVVAAAILVGVGAGLVLTSDGADTETDASFPTLAVGIPAPDPDSAEPAPDFSADLFDGTTFRLSEHQANDGRPVLLNLWASWCFPCREEMPAIDAVAAQHPEILFIGVAVEDDPIAAQAFADEVGVEYALGIDETNRVQELYPALGLPATFLISDDGRILGQLIGGAGEATFEEFVTPAAS